MGAADRRASALVDAPLTDHDPGRVYVVERHVGSVAELDGLCHAYVEHSQAADRPAIEAQRDGTSELLDAVS